MSAKFKDNTGCISDEFLDTFGREFFKHEVLWKSKPLRKQIQSAKLGAYKKIAQALHVSLKDILELSETFPAACLDLMSRYEMLSRVNATCRVPHWLTTLVRYFRFNNKFIKDNNSGMIVSPDLVRSLCESAWAGLAPAGGEAGGRAGTEPEDDASPLMNRRAVAYFAARHRVKEAQILPVWRSVYRLCVMKLLSLVCVGDQAWALRPVLRPRDYERAVGDLALLDDTCVSQIKFLTPAKLRSLVLLFQLIVAAKELYDKDMRQRSDDDQIVSIDNISGDLNCNIRGRSNGVESILVEEKCEPLSDVNVNITPIIIDSYSETLHPINYDKEAVTMSTANDVYYAREKILNDNVDNYTAQNPLQKRVVKCEREISNSDDGQCINELHTELDLEPDINVMASDTSDNELSNQYSINNIENSMILDENRPQESDYNKLDESDIRYHQNKSDMSSKSQDISTRSQYRKENWYEEMKCNANEEQRVVWALVYTDFIKRGRCASLISLQHRWIEVLHRARSALLAACSSDTHTHTHRAVHPLLLVVAHRFPDIVTEHLPSWKALVSERQVVLESDVKDIIHKYQENDNTLLNINENLAIDDLVEEYVTNIDLNNEHGRSKSNVTNKQLSYQEHNEIPSSTIDTIDKIIELETRPQEEENENNELNVDNCISTILDQIDPSKAKVSITFDEDSDEDAINDNNTHRTEPTPSLNSDVLKNKKSGILYEKSNKLLKNALKNIEKEMQDKIDYMNNSVNHRSELNKHVHDNYEVLNDKQNVIDEKLVQLCRVVIIPIEHFPEWKKESRNGVIKCRQFSFKNFTKPVIVNSNQLCKCRPYVNIKRTIFDIQDNSIKSENSSKELETTTCTKSELRIKFEENQFITDFGVIDDINNGIKYQKYIELYSMPDHLRKNRIRLTKKLKLPRTYFSLNFWCLEKNIELMKLCTPVVIKLSKVLPRISQQVNLLDDNRVSKIKESFKTAHVSPSALATNTPDQDQRSCASQEALDSTNKSISSNSFTRQTNNSMSTGLLSPKLLKLLKNDATETKTQKHTVESETKNNASVSNFMDSIIDTMRLAEEDSNQNSNEIGTLNSLQQNPLTTSNLSDFLTSSCNTGNLKSISDTDRSCTVKKSTEEGLNNNSLISFNNSLVNTTPTKIHISSDSTKELYTSHVQKMKNNNITSSNLDKTKILNVSELKDMILLLTKKYNTNVRHEYDNDMKLNSSNLNIHTKMFKQQHRFLVKCISRLNNILPEFILNVEPKEKDINATPSNKRENVDLITQEQAQDNLKISSDDTNNIHDISNNTNSVYVDDDCDPKLVIDERSLKLSDNTDFNNSQSSTISMNMNIRKTGACKRRNGKKDYGKNKAIISKKKTAFQIKDKMENRSKRANKKIKRSNKIEEEKPLLNEYQEWERQKTMALKYFALPMTDNSEVISKNKIALQINDKMESSSKTAHRKHKQSKQIEEVISTEVIDTTAPQLVQTRPQTIQQNNGCQTLISIKRKNTEDLTTTSNAPDVTKRLKLPNENDIVCISDDSSDDDVQITECNIPNAATNRNNPFTAHLENNDIEKGNNLYIFNDPSKDPTTDQNVCVINTSVSAISQPLYIIINGAQTPVTSQDIINTQAKEAMNKPLFLQVLSNAPQFPTLTETLQDKTQQILDLSTKKSDQYSQSGNSLPCQKEFNKICKCTNCQKPTRNENLSCTLKSIQDVAFQDNRRINDAITIEEYLSNNKRPKSLVKVEVSQNLAFFCNKYIILTNLDINSENATYRTLFKTKKYKSFIQVIVPRGPRGSVLRLGSKRESDNMRCRCIRGAQIKCILCDHIQTNLPNTNFLKIGNYYYKKMCENPIKYVRLTRKEINTNCALALEGNPDRIIVSNMHFKKVMDSPPTYVRILSSVPDAILLRLLVRKKVLLYAFDVTTTQHFYTPLKYSFTAGDITVNHSDHNLVEALQWILNK